MKFNGISIKKYNRIFYWTFRKLYRFLCGVQSGIYIQNFDHVHIGKHVRIASGVSIIACNHKLENPDEYEEWRDVYIGDYCWIGTNSVILPGVKLGPHTVVGAGSIVTKSFPKGHCVILGNPSKKIKDID